MQKRRTISKAQQEEFQRGWRDRNKRLKEINLPRETFEQYMEWLYGRGKKAKRERSIERQITKTLPVHTDAPYSSNEICEPNKSAKQHTSAKGKWSSGVPSSEAKPPKIYTGSKIIGIAVLHKSCLQPIFSQEEAINVAKMRR